MRNHRYAFSFLSPTPIPLSGAGSNTNHTIKPFVSLIINGSGIEFPPPPPSLNRKADTETNCMSLLMGATACFLQLPNGVDGNVFRDGEYHPHLFVYGSAPNRSLRPGELWKRFSAIPLRCGRRGTFRPTLFNHASTVR